MPRLRMPRPRSFLIGVPALAAVAVLGMFAGSAVDSRWVRWGVRSAVWVLGGLMVFFVLKLLKRSGGPRKKAEPDRIDQLLGQARKKLKAAGIGGRNALSRLPVVLVLGPRGSAKTTLVLRSGLDAEHLAGDLGSGEAPAPTDALNLWYHEGRIIVEAAGNLAVEPARWAKLVQRLRPRRWLAALLGRRQAPRVAVVCFSVEDLLELSQGDGVAASAKNLRDRLTDLSEAIGIRLPVYVVFTKADGIPHFRPFVENFTEGETEEILGTTLRALGEAPEGTWAERERERLGAAFEELYQALAERRVEVLARGSGSNGEAYEFPREFRKVSRPAMDFLVELCRPHQLRMSPFLRGFYFGGVRPVELEAGAPRPEPAPSFEEATPAGATQVFNLREAQSRARRQPEGPGGTRRVPQWVFLGRIFRSVVLQDRVAMGITTSGLGLSALQRAYWAAGIAVFLVLGLSIVVSFRNERSLQGEVAAAVAGLPAVPADATGTPSVEDLRRLDELRRVTERLSRYENGLRPARSLLFMYTGDDLYPLARREYFERFRPMLFSRAFGGVQSELASPPDPPTFGDYDRIYRALKAYMEMTDAPEHARGEFFGEVLTPYWEPQGSTDEERRELARAQFAFYGEELSHGPNPYGLSSEPGFVGPTREFLIRNTSEESFYRSLVAQWHNRLPPARIAADRPEAAPFLAEAPEVSGAFTRTAWDSVRADLADIDEALMLEPHVVGEGFSARVLQGFATDSLAPRLRALYETDYRDAWVAFLQGARLEGRPLSVARDWLAQLGGNRSAVFQVLAYVDSQTAVGAPAVEDAFGALDALLAPDSLRGARLYSDVGGGYLVQLQTLGQALGRMADSPGDPAAGQAVGGAAATGLNLVGQTALSFPSEPDAARVTSDAVTGLLSFPFQRAEALAGRGPEMAADGLAQAFCTRQNDRVLGRYPFEPGGSEAAVEDVAALLAPGGELQTFLDQVDATGADLNASYDRFRDRARQVARAFYQLDGEMGFDFTFQVTDFGTVDRVELHVDGQDGIYTPSLNNSVRFRWNPATAQQVILTVRTGQNAPVALDFSNTWAIFRLFHQAQWQGGGGEFTVTWSFPDGSRITGIVVPAGGLPLLRRDYLAQFDCPRNVAG